MIIGVKEDAANLAPEKPNTLTMTSDALVQFWDASSVYIRCPICEEIHHHEFNTEYYTERHIELSHDGSDKRCVYRINLTSQLTHEPKYWIDKERGFFVAAGGTTPEEYFRRDELTGTSQMSQTKTSQLPLSDDRKILAVLRRGAPFTDEAARCVEESIQVANKDWTSWVQTLARLLEYPVSEEGDEEGRRFDASHAEKHLIVYFMSKHVIIEKGLQVPEGKEDDSHLVHLIRKISVLRDNWPPFSDKYVTLKRAQIVVRGDKPCEDCNDFLSWVNEKLGLELSIHCDNSLAE